MPDYNDKCVKQQPPHEERCSCEICRLGKILATIVSKCTQQEKNALDEIWARMESAETDIDWQAGKARDDEIITIAGQQYYPEKFVREACDNVRREMLESL